MKRTIITIMLVIMAICPSFATTMCAVNDSVAVVLDPAIGVSGGCRNDATKLTWDCTFPYGIVYGISACVDKNTLTNNRLISTDGTVVTGSFDTTGRYCWCKSIHPVASRWVFHNDFGSAASCASNCADRCASYVRAYASFRVLLFGSVAP